MRATPLTLTIATLACLVAASGQAAERTPHIGYLFPAGGQQGRTFQVLVGGQYLNHADAVHITGAGVSAEVLRHDRALRNVGKPEQREYLEHRLETLSEQRWAELVEQGRVEGDPPWRRGRSGQPASDRAEAKKVQKPDDLHDHHVLDGWEQKTLRELAYIRETLFNWRLKQKRQPNAQLDEVVLIEVTIDPQAAPGPRSLRLKGRGGLTNALRFEVGELPEALEEEQNDPGRANPLPARPPLKLPVLVNGQILPGDVDRIRFRARAGQRLVIETHARQLVPFLADAVPGWFQPTLAVYDAEGRELAFADDYRFDPDPVLRFEPPADGVYALEIRDAIYRGREDFVYRLSIGEFPFITRLFPLGGRLGEPASADLAGWNLPTDTLSLAHDAEGVHELRIDHAVRCSNTVRYQTGTIAEMVEAEPNDAAGQAQSLPALPRIVNGRIGAAGDVDLYRIDGRAGDPLVVEVVARRLGSPLDALVAVLDADGRVIAWNDDRTEKRGHLHPDMGLQTHHADASLRTTFPATGHCLVRVADVTDHGSPAHAYRLRVGPPQPDFALKAVPSAVTVRTGERTPITVHALRRDGFEGPIELALIDPPGDFALDAATIPAGCDQLDLTLVGPTERPDGVQTLRLAGRAQVDGRTITREATPCDDVMQAFLWRHLAPASEMLVVVEGRQRASAPPKIITPTPVRLTPGGSAVVEIDARLPGNFEDLRLNLLETPVGPSGGIFVNHVERRDDRLRFELHAGPGPIDGPVAGNLILEASVRVSWKTKDGQTQSRRRSYGVLPAVPVVLEE